MEYYKTKSNKLPGTNYKQVYKHAWDEFKIIKKRTKRKPYIRSAYFNKEKVFFDYFWNHIRQKRYSDRTRRLRLFVAAVEVIQYSMLKPESFSDTNKKSELLHRFRGITTGKEQFIVQIKENLTTKTKQFISVFPEK